MKTTVVTNTNDTLLTFPVLMIHKDDLTRDDPLIVKFFNEKSGTVVTNNTVHENCYAHWRSSLNFNINQFVKFTGKIIIEQ